MILKHTVLVLALIKIALSYKQYKYHELCPGNKFKAMFDSITNNKPEVRLGEGIESAALIHYHSNSSTVRKIGSCEFNVKLDNPAATDGIFVSIKTLKLRENAYYGDHSCKDFLRFTYKNGTGTREICGNIDTTVHNNLIRNFFDVTSGELKVEISIDTSYLSDSDVVEVYLVFTAYSHCNGNSTLRCSPEKCISNIFREDEILNCPPPGCPDESKCVNNEKPHVIFVKDKPSNESSSAKIIIPVILVVVTALFAILCFCNKKKTTTDSDRPTEHVEELRPTARSDLDSYLDFQDVRPMPLVAEQQHYRPMPLVPEEQHRGLLMPQDQGYNRVMPSAPPGGFSDDPPPYDALFTSNQNKRVNV